MAGRKPKSAPVGRSDFAALLADVKGRIQAAQTRAVMAVNGELVRLYWDIGRIIADRQRREGWGAAVIPRLALKLKNELPDLKGFSERNIKRMLAFHRDYPDPIAMVQQPAAPLPASAKVPQPAAQLIPSPKVPQPVAQLPEPLLWSVPWAHHVILMDKVPDLPTRRWYMEQTLANGWSRNVLGLMIDARAHSRQGKAVANFEKRLPAPQSDLARQTLKDPYIFDFLTLTEPLAARCEPCYTVLGGDPMRHTVRVPIEAIEKLREAIFLLESSASQYRPEFLARMYRARASDLEGKGKSLAAIRKRFSA